MSKQGTDEQKKIKISNIIVYLFLLTFTLFLGIFSIAGITLWYVWKRTNINRKFKWFLSFFIPIAFMAIGFEINHYFLKASPSQIITPLFVTGTLLFIPMIIVWYLWEKTNINRIKKLTFAFLIPILFFGIILKSLAHIYKEPEIIITEPKDGFEIQSDKVTIKGSVNPENSEIKFGNISLELDSGNFSFDAPLNEEINNISLVASNRGIEKSSTLRVKRIFSEEEKKQKEEEKKMREEDEKKKKEESQKRRDNKIRENFEKEREKEEKSKEELMSVSAGVCAKNKVTSLLKAPSSADFSWLDWRIVPTGNGRFNVTGSVDSQNSFGATITTEFYCITTIINYKDALDYSCSADCTFQ